MMRPLGQTSFSLAALFLVAAGVLASACASKAQTPRTGGAGSLGGTGTGGTGNVGGTSQGGQGSGYESLQAFCDAHAGALCAAIGPCCEETPLGFEPARCLEDRVSVCLSVYADGHFDTGAARECVAAQDSLADCGMSPVDTAVCGQVLFRKNLPPGEPCETLSDCASSSTAAGTCRDGICNQIPYGDIGADCSDPNTVRCRENVAVCHEGVCWALLPLGATCSQGSSLCQGGYCDGICVEYPAESLCPR